LETRITKNQGKSKTAVRGVERRRDTTRELDVQVTVHRDKFLQ